MSISTLMLNCFHVLNINISKRCSLKITIELKHSCTRTTDKRHIFCRNNGGIMENMDKGLNKMVADSLAEIPQMPQNLSA